MSNETLAYALKQRGLSHLQFRVLVQLTEMACDREVRAPISNIVERCETTHEQVHAAIKALQKKGITGHLAYRPMNDPVSGDKVLGYVGDFLPCA